MQQQINNGPFYFLIALCLGLVYVVLWAYLKPKKKDNYPKAGKVKKMEVDRLLDLDDHEMHIR